jgi:hypothetical protein
MGEQKESGVAGKYRDWILPRSCLAKCARARANPSRRAVSAEITISASQPQTPGAGSFRRTTNTAAQTMCCALLLLAAVLPPVALGPTTGDEAVIAVQTHGALRLRGGQSLRVRQGLNVPPPPERLPAATVTADVEREWLIHLKGPVHRDLRTQLAQALGVGVDALTYIPRDSFVVSSDRARVQAAKAALPEMLWAGPVLAHHKVSPELHHHVILEDLLRPRQRARARASRSSTRHKFS